MQHDEILSFRLGAEEYGIPILDVQELRSFELPTRLANSALHVLGIIDLRGQIVPILDPRVLLGVEEQAPLAQTVVVIANLRGRLVGLVVDAVHDVVKLPPEAIRPAPEMNGGGLAASIALLGERRILLTDVAALLGEAPRAPAPVLLPA